MAKTIDIDTANRAVSLASYYQKQARIVFGLMGQLPEQRLAITILNWLRDRSRDELASLTIRDVHRARTNGTTANQVRAALRLLGEHGFVHVQRHQAAHGGGRPSERVHVHPSIRPDRTDKTTPSGGSVRFGTLVPVPGDHDFSDWIDQKLQDGHLTECEWLQERKLQALLARSAPGFETGS